MTIGVDPARVRGSGPSWNFASEGPSLFGPSQYVWSTVMKHSEYNLCQYQWILMINEWLCDMSHCCHRTRFWALNAPKMRLRPGLCPDKRLTTAGRKPVLTYSTNQLTQAGVIWICIISGDAGDAETTQHWAPKWSVTAWDYKIMSMLH